MPIMAIISLVPVLPLLLEEFERRYLEALLAHHDRNITHGAKAAGLDRVHFLRLLDRFGLRPRK